MLSVVFPCFTALGEETRKQSVLKTNKQIAEMCSEYDNLSKADGGTIIKKRLIVKTDDNIDEYGAVDYVKGLGYYFLQYNNEKLAENAKKQYEKGLS